MIHVTDLNYSAVCRCGFNWGKTSLCYSDVCVMGIHLKYIILLSKFHLHICVYIYKSPKWISQWRILWKIIRLIVSIKNRINSLCWKNHNYFATNSFINVEENYCVLIVSVSKGIKWKSEISEPTCLQKQEVGGNSFDWAKNLISFFLLFFFLSEFDMWWFSLNVFIFIIKIFLCINEMFYVHLLLQMITEFILICV